MSESDLVKVFSYGDLLYAINRLIEMGKTNVGEIITYICEYEKIDLNTELWPMLSGLVAKRQKSERDKRSRVRRRARRSMSAKPVTNTAPKKNEELALRGKYGAMISHMTPKQRTYWKTMKNDIGIRKTVDAMVRKYG